MCITFVN